MGDRRNYLINRIVWVCHKLDQKGFGANHDGNVTALFENTILATPTSISKGLISPELILTLDMEGKKIEGIGSPFSELQLHLAAYRTRNDVRAVVHAHPPYATARGLLGLPLRPSIAEAVVSIGDFIPVIPFIMPGDRRNEQVISEALEKTDVLMMQGNGVLSVGVDVEQAYLRLELVEHVAKIHYIAERMGKPFEITEEDLKSLLEKRFSLGLGPVRKVTPSQNVKASEAGINFEDISRIVAEEIRKALKEGK